MKSLFILIKSQKFINEVLIILELQIFYQDLSLLLVKTQNLVRQNIIQLINIQNQTKSFSQAKNGSINISQLQVLIFHFLFKTFAQKHGLFQVYSQIKTKTKYF